MEWIISSAALIAAASSLSPAGQRPGRTVELISLSQPAPDQIVQPEQAMVADHAAEPRLPASNSFRVQNLSRGTHVIQVTKKRAQASALAEAPLAGRTSRPDATTELIIPAWMRSDQPLPSLSSAATPQCLGARYRPTGFLKTDAELRRARYFALMSGAACQHGIPVELFDAMIIQESRYDPFALSPKRAFGLSQLMPDTAESLGVDRFDIADNLRGGARYLRGHIDRFGRYDLALAAYNAGPGRIRNGRIPGITETRSYVGSILDYWTRLTKYVANDEIGIDPNIAVPNRRVSLQYFHSSH